MKETYNLAESKQTKLNASGTGSVFLGPGSYEKWNIQKISVTTTDLVTSTTVPTAKIYYNEIGDATFLGGTYSGNLDSSNENLVLERNQRLYCQWTGGGNGSTATLTVYGTRETY